ncbi:MAG: IS701 family transposase [Terriglobia bacterium]
MKRLTWNARVWKESVEQFHEFLRPLLAGLGRSERRVAAARYVEGLLTPGHRKSIGPMAERLGVDSQSLQQFVTDSPWSEEALWQAVRQEVVPSLEPLEAWVVDETGWIKQGAHSVGVSHQYCGAVGKQANCQVSVEVVVSDGWIAAPVGGRLYLPESWTQDRERCAAVGVPEEVAFATKPELAVSWRQPNFRPAISSRVKPPSFSSSIRVSPAARHTTCSPGATTNRKRARRPLP